MVLKVRGSVRADTGSMKDSAHAAMPGRICKFDTIPLHDFLTKWLHLRTKGLVDGTIILSFPLKIDAMSRVSHS